MNMKLSIIILVLAASISVANAAKPKVCRGEKLASTAKAGRSAVTVRKRIPIAGSVAPSLAAERRRHGVPLAAP
jgi:hypothetical protein